MVVRVVESATNVPYAMKIIDKKRCRGHEAHIISEISILKKLKHDNIVNLYDVYETKDKLYLQMEYVTGGELFDRIVNEGFYSESRAKDLVRCIVDAIHYLHSQRIVHRDLKPENLLMATKAPDSPIKVADFGLANHMNDANSMLTTCCGTLTYAAPEILKMQGYNEQVDMWSVGVITYILLSGYPPFAGDSEATVLQAALDATFEFFSPEWDQISTAAKDFIKRLIVVDPKSRMSAQQALNHHWLKQDLQNLKEPNAQSDELVNLMVKSNLVKNFNAKRKFKSTAEAVLAINKLSSSKQKSSSSSLD